MQTKMISKTSRGGVLVPAAAALVLTLIVGCRGCGSDDKQNALIELPAKEAQVAFSVGDLTRAAVDMKAFFDAATKKGGAMAANVQGAAKQQLGFDPFDAAGYAEAGIDPKAGLIFFSEGASPAVLLGLKVRERKKLDSWLAATLKRLDGASEIARAKEEGLDITTAGRPFGTELVPVSHWTYVDDVVLVSAAEGKASLINAAKRIAAGGETRASLADDALYEKLSAKIPVDSAFRLFLRGTAATMLTGQEPSELSKGAVLGMSFGDEGFGGDFFVDFAVADLANAMGERAPAELAQHIGGDALLAMMTRSAKLDALRALENEPTLKSLIGGALAAFEREAGMDAEAKLLPLLEGSLTGAVYLVDPARAMATLQRGRTDPNALLDVVHASVTAQVRDRDEMLVLLDDAMKRLETPKLKFVKTDEDRNGKPLTRYEPDRPTPRLGWALYGNTYVYGAGTGRLDSMLELLDAKSPSLQLSAPAKELAEKKGASVFVFRVGAIGERVGAMATDFGAAGPMLGQIVTSAVETAKTIGDVAVALEADPDGLRFSVREKLGSE